MSLTAFFVDAAASLSLLAEFADGLQATSGSASRVDKVRASGVFFIVQVSRSTNPEEYPNGSERDPIRDGMPE
jgi:hypothetical protein